MEKTYKTSWYNIIILDMSKTLSENGIEDETTEFENLDIPLD